MYDVDAHYNDEQLEARDGRDALLFGLLLVVCFPWVVSAFSVALVIYAFNLPSAIATALMAWQLSRSVNRHTVPVFAKWLHASQERINEADQLAVKVFSEPPSSPAQRNG